jgi:hypothetical protein
MKSFSNLYQKRTRITQLMSYMGQWELMPDASNILHEKIKFSSLSYCNLVPKFQF